MKDLTSGNIRKNFLLFSIPLIISSILTQSFSLINTAVAGKFLGDSGIAATGCTSGFINLIAIGIFSGYALGNSIRVAMLFGKHEKEKIKSNYVFNYLLLLAACLLTALCVWLFDDGILRILKVEDGIFQDAKRYMVITFFGLILAKLNENSMYTLNAMGITSVGVYTSLANAVLTVIGNVLSVAVWDFGVVGIACSTVIANLCVCIFYHFVMRHTFAQMGTLECKVTLDFSELRIGAPYTIPSIAQQLTIYAAMFIISPMINVLGDAAIASYTIASRLRSYVQVLYHSSSRTVCNFSAQCVGASKTHLLRDGLRTSLLQGIAFAAPVLLVCILFPNALCSLFFQDTGTEAFRITVIFARFYLPFVLIHMIVNVFHSFFRGIGKARLLLVLTMIGSGAQIVFNILLIQRVDIWGVYLGWILSWVVETVAIIIIYYFGKWREMLTPAQSRSTQGV